MSDIDNILGAIRQEMGLSMEADRQMLLMLKLMTDAIWMLDDRVTALEERMNSDPRG